MLACFGIKGAAVRVGVLVTQSQRRHWEMQFKNTKPLSSHYRKQINRNLRDDHLKRNVVKQWSFLIISVQRKLFTEAIKEGNIH